MTSETTHHHAATHVAVIGLGAMGEALAGALLAAGHPTTVWNRTAAKADALVERGAELAATPAEAIAAADLAIVCLLDQDVALEVLDGAGEALPGTTIVNVTNGTPDQARAVHARVAERGGALLAGGIMAVPPMIGEPEALILFSGAQDVFAAAEPVLAVLGRPLLVGEDPGDAPLYDQALLSGMYGMFAGAEHALALVSAGGGDPESFMSTLLMPWLAAMLPLVPETVNAAGEVSAESNAAMQAAALESILSTSAALGIDDVRSGHLRSSLEAMRQAAAATA